MDNVTAKYKLTAKDKRDLREALGNTKQDSDTQSCVIKRDGTVLLRQTFYYRHGRDERQHAQWGEAELQKLGFEAELIECGEHYACWPKDSYWWASFRITGRK